MVPLSTAGRLENLYLTGSCTPLGDLVAVYDQENNGVDFSGGELFQEDVPCGDYCTYKLQVRVQIESEWTPWAIGTVARARYECDVECP